MYSLICLDRALLAEAKRWCDMYGLTLAQGTRLPAGGFHLCLDFTGLSLRSGDDPKVQVQVNFSEGAVAHRRRFGGGMGQDIAKAIGVSSSYKPSVIDATAGLGRDSFVLATLGCEVTAIERQPVVAALLADGLQRAINDIDISEIIARIHLKYGQSQTLISDESDQGFMADIVYLDPMFDHDPKQTAKVKKRYAGVPRYCRPGYGCRSSAGTSLAGSTLPGGGQKSQKGGTFGRTCAELCDYR